MNKERLLTILVIVLAILNLVILGFLFSKNQRPNVPGPEDGQRNEEMFQKAFQFDKSQMASFRKAKEEHREKIVSIHKDLQSLSEEYFLISGNESSTDSLILLINEKNEEIYKLNHQHIDEVRKICNEEQLKEMPDFIKSLLNKGRPGEKPPRR